MAKSKARTLRKAITEAEKFLWSILRNRQLGGLKFRRQHPVVRYVADFACFEHRLIVEADGGQHNERPSDEQRTINLQNEGWRVLRFWNNEILENIEGVAARIREASGLATKT